MIFAFPDSNTLRLALSTGIVPVEVALAPAMVADVGSITVETDAKLPKKSRDELERLGVNLVKRHVADARPVSCWLQVLPLAKMPSQPIPEQAPVLFELASATHLATVVGEMLRLGNDRQSYCFLSDGRVLLRVIGPPYYTLLRAGDSANSGIRAFLEAAPRVWLELGYSQPLLDKLVPAEGQILLVRASQEWEYFSNQPIAGFVGPAVPDDPRQGPVPTSGTAGPTLHFADVYEIVDFQLPSQPVTVTPSPATTKLTVPLRLAAGNAADVPELWVLSDDGVGQLDRLVRDSDDRLAEQLAFAVATDANGQERVILRTRPSKKQSPVLALENAVGYKSYWRLPHLFLPVSTRLHPTLRRDAVTKLLADDSDRLVWLSPASHGGFTPESLPADAFRPLSDWVDYVIAANRVDIAAWIGATTFDFDAFTLSETGPSKPKGPGDKSPKEKPTSAGPKIDAGTTKKSAAVAEPQPAAEYAASTVEAKPPSEWRIICDDLEKQFLDFSGALDAPERQHLWPKLATANAGLGDDRRSEAAVCWVNALWEATPLPKAWVEGWLRSELPTIKMPVTAAEFDARLAGEQPTPAEARAVVALLLAVATQTPMPVWLKSRLPKVQAFLERSEHRLPIRAVWLAAIHMAYLVGSDVLGIARVRDRVLQRLLDRGLSPEQDLPTFLRFAGLKDSDRARLVRDKANELHNVARDWVQRSLAATAPRNGLPLEGWHTLAYVDLMFAFGLASLGDSTSALAHLAAARQVLNLPNGQDQKALISTYLCKAFEFRIREALDGRPHVGAMSKELREEFDRMQAKKAAGGTTAPNPTYLVDYLISRMREQSRILEPEDKFTPYADQTRKDDELRWQISDLPKVRDPAVLMRTVRDLLKNGVKGKPIHEVRLAILHTALPLAPRAGAEFTLELVEQVIAALKQAPNASTPGLSLLDLVKYQGELTERALFLAAHFDRTDVVRQLIDQFIVFVRAKPDEQRFEFVNAVARQCVKSLRKLGLRDEIDSLLRRLQEEVLKGKTLAQLKQQHANKPEVWYEVLQTCLNLAAGWLTFGLTDQATAIIDIARQEIVAPQAAGDAAKHVLKFTKLCQTYVAALGSGPADFGLPRIVELFRTLDPARITNTFTSAQYYSRFHLNLIEDVVLATAGDEFALGAAGRRWLDEDEYLVRRRIHRDMRTQVTVSGLG